MAGWHRSRFLALRLLTNGSLDSTYGAFGYSLVAFDLASSKDDQLHAAAIQADGKVVLAGFAETTNVRDFAISRLNVDGSLDSTFGAGGKQVIDFYPAQQTAELAYDVTIDTSQRILLVGETTAPGASDPMFALTRLTSSGSLDASFSTDGRQMISFPYPHGSRAWAVAQVANNKLVAVGEASYTTTDRDFAAVRLLDDGTLDPGFGSQGFALVPFDIGAHKTDLATDLTIQLDGGIVMVGIVDTGTAGKLDLDWGVAKLTGEPFFSFP